MLLTKRDPVVYCRSRYHVAHRTWPSSHIVALDIWAATHVDGQCSFWSCQILSDRNGSHINASYYLHHHVFKVGACFGSIKYCQTAAITTSAFVIILSLIHHHVTKLVSAHLSFHALFRDGLRLDPPGDFCPQFLQHHRVHVKTDEDAMTVCSLTNRANCPEVNAH